MLLVRYDDYFYYFNDLSDSKARTYYRISLANGSDVEMSMELTQIIKQKRIPSDQAGQEMKIFENITELHRCFSSGQIIDREAIGSFFSETSVATTMTIGGVILIAIMAVLAFVS